MKNPEYNRRDFGKLAAAAFGGMIAGAAGGCGESGKKEAPAAKNTPAPPPKTDSSSAVKQRPEGHVNPKRNGHDRAAAEELKKKIEAKEGDFVMITDKNVCRGLNMCKNHKGGSNECAGRGDCAVAKAHSCHGKNECKGQGGCGEKPGLNECSGKGECAVPLMDDAWKKARDKFESVMAQAGRPIGDAPEKKK